MNEFIESTCTCDNCPGEGCTCVCQAITASSTPGCACGTECNCGPDCRCEAASA